jgi:hypothetical protein
VSRSLGRVRSEEGVLEERARVMVGKEEGWRGGSGWNEPEPPARLSASQRPDPNALGSSQDDCSGFRTARPCSRRPGS